MPTYLEPLQGVSLSEAEAEAATIAPTTRVVMEIWCPALTETV